jgi:hypothetical protein
MSKQEVTWNSVSGRSLAGDDLRAAAELQAFLKRYDPRDSSGVMLITQYADGFGLQYIGSEQIDHEELADRVIWVAHQLALARAPLRR